MPRLARVDAPGVLHHVMIRGIERRKMFLTNGDREDFLERLARLLPETKTACYAWVFIPNHAHFLFRTGLMPLAKLMRRLLKDMLPVSTADTSGMANYFRIVINSLPARRMPILRSLSAIFT